MKMNLSKYPEEYIIATSGVYGADDISINKTVERMLLTMKKENKDFLTRSLGMTSIFIYKNKLNRYAITVTDNYHYTLVKEEDVVLPESKKILILGKDRSSVYRGSEVEENSIDSSNRDIYRSVMPVVNGNYRKGAFDKVYIDCAIPILYFEDCKQYAKKDGEIILF